MNSCAVDTRRDRIRRAKQRHASIFAPREVLLRFPASKATRDVYAALLACQAEGIQDPRQQELVRVAGVSLQSVVRGLDALIDADLVEKGRTVGVGRPCRYWLLLEDGGRP